ncbi:MAG: gliding motility protein GldN [Bacteroidaceae bacterium]|nr:gliding motility protein GldN [Bacteroidaceae bacterium]
MKATSIYSLVIVALLLCISIDTNAQPTRRRTQTTTQQTRSQSGRAGGATYREFPAAQTMPADADWRRDVYRELDLMKDQNAPLYYPIIPQNGRTSLFTYLLKLVLRGQIKAYRYNTSATEDFSASNTVRPIDILNQFEIPYDTAGGRLRLNDADIPTEEVMYYFVKESTYYDQHTATFHSRVVALCPVLLRGDDYGGTGKRAMFWVKYEEAAPYLGKLMILYSNLNNAAQMSADDYFTQNLYQGDIYMATNLQDRLLISSDDQFLENDTTLQARRDVIEHQLDEFEQHVWRGDSVAQAANAPARLAQPDVQAAADSTAIQEDATVTTTTRQQTTTRRAGNSRRTRTSARAPKQRRQRSSAGSTGSGYSVRRQRH